MTQIIHRIPTLGGLLLATAAALASGCAANDRQPAVRGPGKDLARQWAEAARQPAEEAKPAPEPKLLPLTHFTAGNLLEKQGNYLQAIGQYRKAIELNASFGAAYSRLGLCYTKTGQYDQAVKALQQAVKLQPPSAQIWNNLGFAWMAQRDYRKAEECLTRALQVNSRFARARLNLAIALVQQNRDIDALGHLLAVAPEPIAQYNLGTMQLAAGRAAEARGSFQRALQLQANFEPARKGLAESQARLAQAQAVAPQATASAAPAKSAVPEPAKATVAAAPEAAAPAAPAPPRATTGLAAAVEPAPPGPPQAVKAGPTTRPIVGVDDEPALANAPAGLLPEMISDCLEIVLAPAIELPTPQAFACMRPVSFVDEAGQAIRWRMSAAQAARDLPTAAAATVPPEDPLMQAVVCYATSRDADAAGSLDAADSVADLDLASLRWAAWTDAVACLDADVAHLGGQELQVVLSKWLSALNELEAVTPTVYGATAYADDM